MSSTINLTKKALSLCTVLALGSLCVTAAHADSFKRNGKTYQSIGTVQGELDNKKTEWIVIDGHLVSALPGSALWEQESLEIPDQEQIMKQFQEAMSSSELSPEEAKQIELIANMLSEAGPMIEAFKSMGLGDDGMENISIDIDAFDPNQDDPFDAGRISIHTSISADTDPSDLPIYANDIDITYVLSGGDTLFLPETAYWSEESYGYDAPKVKFTYLDLDKNGTGRVKGEFSATLCYWEKAKMMQGTNKDKCIPFKGDFDTAIYPMPKG